MSSRSSDNKNTSCCGEDEEKYPLQDPNYISFEPSSNAPRPVPHFYSNPVPFYSNPNANYSNQPQRTNYSSYKRKYDNKNDKYNYKRCNRYQYSGGQGTSRQPHNRPFNKYYCNDAPLNDYILPIMLEDPWHQLVQDNLEQELLDQSSFAQGNLEQDNLQHDSPEQDNPDQDDQEQDNFLSSLSSTKEDKLAKCSSTGNDDDDDDGDDEIDHTSDAD